MAAQTDPGPARDSLDLVELVMAIEEALSDPQLTPGQREQFRKLGPRNPRGQAGAAAQSEEPFYE